MPDLARFTVSLPADLASPFDKEIGRRGYTSRSEAVRDLIRDMLVESEWESGAQEVVATVTLVFDHSSREVSDHLTELQHRHSHAVVCSTHVHLDRDNCLEVVVLKGDAQEVRAISERLTSRRGVKHGRMVCSTTGATLA